MVIRLKRLVASLCLLSCINQAMALELQRPDLPERSQRGEFKQSIVFLGSDMEVFELSASGQQTIKQDDTEKARAAVATAVDGYFAEKGQTQLIKPTGLTQAEQDEIKEYAALYDVVAASSFRMINQRGWEGRKQHFDYTLGSGLPWLKEKTGARYALLTHGLDYVSSGGRVAMFIAFAAVGVAIPMGRSVTVTGLIDLDNGDLVWLSSDDGIGDLKNVETLKTRYSKQFDHMLQAKAQ